MTLVIHDTTTGKIGAAHSPTSANITGAYTCARIPISSTMLTMSAGTRIRCGAQRTERGAVRTRPRVNAPQYTEVAPAANCAEARFEPLIHQQHQGEREDEAQRPGVEGWGRQFRLDRLVHSSPQEDEARNHADAGDGKHDRIPAGEGHQRRPDESAHAVRGVDQTEHRRAPAPKPRCEVQIDEHDEAAGPDTEHEYGKQKERPRRRGCRR